MHYTMQYSLLPRDVSTAPSESSYIVPECSSTFTRNAF